MNTQVQTKYRNITVSGKYAVGTTTLAKSLQETLGWKYINTGEIQREYDKKHGVDSNRQGAVARSDEHEREMEEMAKRKLTDEDHLVYEAWLSGFVAREISGVLKVLLYCSEDAIRIDRIVNRDGVSVEEAKQYIRQREEENISKWKRLYGDHDFWDPKYYDVVIDTFASGPMETLGRVLDKLNVKK